MCPLWRFIAETTFSFLPEGVLRLPGRSLHDDQVSVVAALVRAGLVPVLRAKDPSLPKAAANAFNRIAWPAYWVLVATGLWNVMAERADTVAASPGWDMVLGIKVLLVALSGVAAFVHTRATTTTGLAVWGALSGLSAIAAVYVGILLAG